ncbi:hypothetical protein [Massilia sp. 9I]|uniref:hypothetical protein n=1 Tax=Massilia sp. 9I TaxID=2653152 RepID=UPI0012F1749D|nr:hypothetical protein [Massilia sp. 9I]VXB89796.1 conserved hypothetical protein [Massilia sp. 9I]
MGENKGHGVKGPRHDNDVDDLSINTASGKIAQGGQQQSGNMHPGQQQQDSMQSGQQQGNRQSGPQAGQQQGNKQSGQQQGSQQSSQQGSQQSGGQHASGGTPALDDLGSRQGESAKDASQAWSQDSGNKQQGNR